MRTTISFTLAVAAALFLAGCSDDESSTPTHEGMPGMTQSTTSATRADFNDADVAFLEQMYPHHAQAVEMAALAASRSQNPEVLQLATAIEQAQQPEMATITTLLASFGRPAPGAMGMDHSGHGGMMSDQQMRDLEATSGADFDRMFLTLMIVHHTGAIEMANTELAGGVNTDAKALASAIVSAQQAEIDRMRTMLG